MTTIAIEAADTCTDPVAAVAAAAVVGVSLAVSEYVDFVGS